jgi:hypothetical protein
VGLLGPEFGPSQRLCLYMTKIRGHTSMPRVVFEPTIPVFQRPQTARSLWSTASSFVSSVLSFRVCNHAYTFPYAFLPSFICLSPCHVIQPRCFPNSLSGLLRSKIKDFTTSWTMVEFRYDCRILLKKVLKERTVRHIYGRIIQGYSKRSIHFQKIILQVQLDIWWHATHRLKGENSKLFSHLTSTLCEPHMWRGRCKIDNLALPTLVAACHRWQQPQPQRYAASDHRYQNFERFPFHLYTGHGFNVISFCKINFWKWILLFE